MKAQLTPLFKYKLVEGLRDTLLTETANTYVGIGRPLRWGNDATETEDEIENIVYSTNYRNEVYRDMVAAKKIAAADIALVVPRVDWETGTTYDEYQDHIAMFSHEVREDIGDANTTSGSTLVTATTAGDFLSLSVGEIIEIANVKKEIINIDGANDVLNVNTAFAATYTGNTLLRISNAYPRFANTFYVRNTKDQVFKCLHQPIPAVASTIEPEINIDGQLPENPYILTSDGYKWKYLYTIPYGMKQKFFTSTWMPVVSDNAVLAGAVDGRIDIIDILTGGEGYLANGNSNTASIITVAGDGINANVTAKVEYGVITDLNILAGGQDYTYATIAINDATKLAGNSATFDVVISPPGGHGSDPLKELGCYSCMISLDIEGSENGKIPVYSATSGAFDFRQISLIRDPIDANNYYANASVYRVSTLVRVTDPGSANFINDETVYVGPSLVDSSFSATTTFWDSANNTIYLNDLVGSFNTVDTLRATDSGLTATILSTEPSELKLFSGDVLYIENRLKVERDLNQTEQIRLIISV